MSDLVIVWEPRNCARCCRLRCCQWSRLKIELRNPRNNSAKSSQAHLSLIVFAGALFVHRGRDHWEDAIGAPHGGERTEKQRILQWL